MAEHVRLVENLTVEQPEVPPQEVRPPELTAEQLQAVDQVFSTPAEQSAAGMLGLWSSTVILRDLMIDHLDGREEKRKPARKKSADAEEEGEEDERA